MDERDEQRQAAETLATIRAHQERARRAARLPWWVYAAMFVLTAGGTAANDFVDLTGAKLVAALILLMFVVVLVVSFASGSAPLSKVRGVQPRQQFVPRAFLAVAVVGALGAWLLVRYGNGFAHDIAGAVGLGDYPDTAAGVLYGVAFTALFALSQLLSATSQRRKSR